MTIKRLLEQRGLKGIILALFAVLLPAGSNGLAADDGQTEKPFYVQYPDDNQIIKGEMTYLVARVEDRRVNYVVVKVNEQLTPVVDITTEEYKKFLGDTIIVRLFLLPGRNTIEMLGRNRLGLDVVSQKLTLFYQKMTPKGLMTAPPEFVSGRMHMAEKEAPCKKCHRMEVDAVADIDPLKKHDLFCVECHEAGMEGYLPHGAATWKCLQCHGDAETVKYSLKDSQGGYCSDCHAGDLARFTSMTSIHPSVAKRECMTCHVMHTGEGEYLTGGPVNVICFRCHKKHFAGSHVTPGHPMEAKKDPSRKGKEFNCVSCHDPHSANKKSLMRFNPGMMMCQACHSM